MATKKIIGLAVAVCVAAGLAWGVVWMVRGGHLPGMAPRHRVSAFSNHPFSANITIVTKTASVHNLQPGQSPNAIPETPVTYHGKMYADRKALRTDIDMEPGLTASVIIRYDKGVAWVLMPSHRYIQTPIQERTDLLSMLRDGRAHIQKDDLGAESVGAYPCEKYHVVATEKGQRETGLIWVAKQRSLKGFIVKAQDERTQERITFSDIQMAAPKPAVFEIPAGYQKLSTTPQTQQAPQPGSR